MARKVATTATPQQTAAAVSPVSGGVVGPSRPQWHYHIESIRKFHSFPPMPKQQRHVVVLPGTWNTITGTTATVQAGPAPSPAPARNSCMAFSRRNAITNFRVSGPQMDEPVEDIVRTLLVNRPTAAAVSMVHDIALLTAEYYDLMNIKKRAAGGPSGGVSK